MGDNLVKIIKNVESKWLQDLTDVCTRQFSDCHLPSHDHTHHLRVWDNAKVLLKHLPGNANFHEEDIEQLIISVFFHDQGMSFTISKEHGKISRQLCKEYLEKSELPTSHINKILDAVELHDNKKYTNTQTPNSYSLLSILNVADDLDAFGIIGVYRYIEIYCLRKTPIHEMPELIADNLRGRFQHFSTFFSHNKPFIKSQNQHYISSRSFFNDLGLQLKQIDYTPELLIGPIGIVNYINSEIIHKKNSLKNTIQGALAGEADFYFSNFFEKLSKYITVVR